MKKKILFLMETLTGGGAEKVLVDLLNNIDYDKYDVELIVFYNQGIYFDQINKNVKVKTLIKNTYIARGVTKYLKKIPGWLMSRIFIRDKYDVEIAFMEGVCTKIIGGVEKRSSKRIAWVHIDLNKQHWTTRVFKTLEEEQSIYNRFNDIVFVSKDTGSGFNQLFTVDNPKKHVIYNLIEVDKIINRGKEPISSYDYNGIVICTVGRLMNQKGFDRLINAHKKLVDEGLKHTIIILGEGEEREKLENLIKTNNLDDSVQLLGFHKNPYKYIYNSDAFICSSRSEGFSLVVAEAIVLEKPIISTKCSGPIELLDGGNYGMLVENSTEGIYEGIKKFITSKELREEYVEKVKLRKEFFNKETIIKNIEEIIDHE